MSIRIAHFHQPAAADDGTRVMVDRYWPRAENADAQLAWRRDLAPSPELVAWFGRKPERWDVFKERYRQELEQPKAAAALAGLREIALSGRLTLVTGARDRRFSAALALAELIDPEREHIEMATQRRAPLTPVPAWRRIALEEAVDWLWLALGLMAPMLVLIPWAVAFNYGSSGVVAVASILAILTFAVLVRSAMRENRRRQLLQLQYASGDAEAVWAGFRDFGTSIVGFTAGVGLLGGGIALAVFLSGFRFP